MSAARTEVRGLRTERKNRVEIFLMVLCSVLSAQSSALAAFLDSGATARAVALGGSYVAIADDAATLTMNMAGLASVHQPEVVADYSRLSMGLTDGSKIAQSYVGGAAPLSLGGTVGLGWKQLNVDSLYTERVLSLGYGRWWTPRLAVGAGIKQLHVSYSPDNQVVDDFGTIQPGTPDLFSNGTDRTAYSADFGMLYKWKEKSLLALAMQDINEPNIALSGSDRDAVARTLRMGWASEVRPQVKMAIGMQTRKALANQRDWIWTGGAEKYWAETTTGRFGIRGSLSAGSREYRRCATGASYGFGPLQLDYTFSMGLSGITWGDSAGDHRFSMSYRFGAPAKQNLVSIPESQPSTLAMNPVPLDTDIEMLNPVRLDPSRVASLVAGASVPRTAGIEILQR